jgi:hypothetical protein
MQKNETHKIAHLTLNSTKDTCGTGHTWLKSQIQDWLDTVQIFCILSQSFLSDNEYKKTRASLLASIIIKTKYDSGEHFFYSLSEVQRPKDEPSN